MTKKQKKTSMKRKKRGGIGMFSMKSFSPSRTMNNISRKSEKFGEIPYIVFFCTILSRLAYLPIQGFVYTFNTIINNELLTPMNNKLSSETKTDLECFDLMNKYANASESEQGYKLNSIALFVNNTIQRTENELISGNSPLTIKDALLDGPTKYFSLAWSKYGNIYIVSSKACPNIIFVIFRGTYSAATARIYTKLRTAKPVTLCKDDTNNVGVLYGIYKATCQLSHTIIECATKLVELQGFETSRIITTGHSLGGGMTTFFASLFYEAMNQPKYIETNTKSDNTKILHTKPICVSVAAPLVLNKYASVKYCTLVKKQQIFFKRLITRGDPVIMIPNLGQYSHICDDKSSKDPVVSGELTIKELINMNCNNTFNSVVMDSLKSFGSSNKNGSRVLDNVSINYDANLDCLKKKPRLYAANPLSHTIYLNISFITGVDISAFMGGLVSRETKEIIYDKSETYWGESVVRIIEGQVNESSETHIKMGFFKFNLLLNESMKKQQLVERKKEQEAAAAEATSTTTAAAAEANDEVTLVTNPPSDTQSTSNELIKISPQDVYMNNNIFNKLLTSLVPLTNNEIINKGQIIKDYKLINELQENYNNNNTMIIESKNEMTEMPVLYGCLNNFESTGGGKKRTRKIKRKRKNKTKKQKNKKIKKKA